MTERVVPARDFSGYSMSFAQLWGRGPKFTIRCGACPATFTERIPLVDNPTVRCPHCHVWNELALEVN
jgi:hypothetical protein